MKFFTGCTDFKDVQSKYRILLKQYHPDLNREGLETTKQIILEYKKISENRNQVYPIDVYSGSRFDTDFLSGFENFEEWLKRYAPKYGEEIKEEPIDWNKYYKERPDEYEWNERYQRWFPIVKRNYGKKFRGRLPMEERIRRWVRDAKSANYRPNWVYYKYKKFCYEKNLPIQLSEVQYIGEQINSTEVVIKKMYDELIKEDLAKTLN